MGAAQVAAAFALSGPLTLVNASAQTTPQPKPSIQAQTQAPASPNALAAGYHAYKVGDAQCYALYDGVWNVEHAPGFVRNANTAAIKAALAAAGAATDRVQIPYTVTLIKHGGKTVLIDSGSGAQLGPTSGRLARAMRAAGLPVSQIDIVAISHFHADHIFGLMAAKSNRQIFAQAAIMVPEAELQFWTDPSARRAIPLNQRPLADRITATFPKWRNLKTFRPGDEVAPGLRAIAAPGHTPGHTVFHLASAGAQLFVTGDLANIPALFVRHPHWHASFDMDGPLAESHRRRLFERAIAEKALVAGYHFGLPNVGALRQDGRGYAFVPLGG
ncbi:MAG: MBL fold metallo-hydrolase [Pseudomonadota bacterium]